MGPRHFSRGIDPLLGRPAGQLPGFNGAAAFQPRNFLGPAARPDRFGLQWGRGISAAELPCSIGGMLPRYDASMGPRHFSRGISYWRWTDRRMLQCFNGAAAFQPRNLVYSVDSRQIKALQWGRGISAAEFRICWASGLMTHSFNGAAAFQPRNFEERAYVV